MFTVFATDDISVVNFNDCLLAAGMKGNGPAFGCIFKSSADGDAHNISAKVALRLRFDSDRRHGMEASHVRKLNGMYMCVFYN